MPANQHSPVPPKPLRHPAHLDVPTEAELDAIGHRAEVEAVRLAGVDLSHRDCTGSSWNGVLLEDSSLAGCELAGAFLTDLRLEQADLANVTGRGASIVRVEANGGRMLGLSLSEALVQDATFDQVQLDLAGFRFARLERVVFRRCRMHEADFSNAALRSVLFDDCDLTGVDLSRATFERVELRGCTLEGVRGVHDLEGVSMSLVDVVEIAPLFARACGVHVIIEPV